MDRSRFLEIWGKVRSGEASPEEQLELNQHLKANPEDIRVADAMDEFWATPLPAETAADSEETGAAWSRFQENLTTEDQPAIQRDNNARRIGNTKRMTRWLAGVAAVAIIAIAGSWLWGPAKTQAITRANTVSTKNGSRSKVDMPDGTQIWLNVGSRIHYDASFGKTNRDLSLEGEAFFDVAHDASLPFIIHTKKLTVRVLGTSFNVKAYPSDETTEASLIKGSIEVTFPDDPNKRIVLKPDEKISIANTDQPSLKRKNMAEQKPAMVVSKVNYQPADSTVIETAWVGNRLIFRAKTFEAVSKDMERWFNVTINIHDSAILDRKFTGNFGNENITDALEALSLTYPFRFDYEKNQNTVNIYSK